MTRGEITACAHVVADIDRHADLPDPVGYADLEYASEIVAGIVRRRAAEGIGPHAVSVFAWPKSRTGRRPMACMDPLDLVAYRALVGRHAPSLAARVDPTVVLSARLDARPPAWRTEHFQGPIEERRDRGLEFLDAHGMLATLDITEPVRPGDQRPRSLLTHTQDRDVVADEDRGGMRSWILFGGLAMVVAVGACAESDGVANSTSAGTAATESEGTVASTGGATATAGPSAAADDSITSPPSASPGPSSATEPAVVSFEVVAYEWKFKQDSWTVAAGEDVTIAFDNRGGVEHDWTILALGERITKLSEFGDDMVLFQIESVPRLESVTETFRIDEPGTYQVICTLSGHFNTGMGGTLEVR